MPPGMLEMADALRMTRTQRFLGREAAPIRFALAGVRTAARVSVAIATLPAFIGAGAEGVHRAWARADQRPPPSSKAPW